MSSFADEVSFEIIAGRGGDGAVSFRREKFVARGGPDGGDGGDGGDIIIRADHNLNTLADLTRKKTYKAQNGEGGKKKKSAGKAGKDLIIKVPVGTQIFERVSRRAGGSPARREKVKGEKKEFLIADLDESGDEFLAAKGGEGGMGNARFARASFQTPRFAELGEPGEEREVVLKLKIVADVGLIGMPSVGKSTLLSVISNARPKIADYHFTTLIPNLGIVRLKDTSFIVADVPGLIEGASQGKGLGIRFLKHVERTKLLVHILDATSENPKKDFQKINSEMKKYDKMLGQKPQLVVFNKIDVATEEQLKKIKKIKFRNFPAFYISAATHKNVQNLVNNIASTLPKVEHKTKADEIFKIFTLRDLPYVRFEVVKKRGYFEVKGPRQERLATKTDVNNPQALARFYKVLKRMGVLGALKKAGAKEGDKVRIGSKEFEFEEI
ncbi:hypothetical protein DRH29_01735 [candidate division Kazan bacterium]|uniref:GTPase Obg n=1 Tax=candidate division Kazan bacterium TaxID=2202143 RepID=A0A420ZD49_UNCK3|nr:MAG: hypothetical protein DRH29_01735 [candidate division Kazan bacterium]